MFTSTYKESPGHDTQFSVRSRWELVMTLKPVLGPGECRFHGIGVKCVAKSSHILITISFLINSGIITS